MNPEYCRMLYHERIECQRRNREALLKFRTQLRNSEQASLLERLLQQIGGPVNVASLCNTRGECYRAAVFSSLVYRIFRVNADLDFERRSERFDFEDYRRINYPELMRASASTQEQVGEALEALADSGSVSQRCIQPTTDKPGYFWIRLNGEVLWEQLQDLRCDLAEQKGELMMIGNA